MKKITRECEMRFVVAILLLLLLIISTEVIGEIVKNTQKESGNISNYSLMIWRDIIFLDAQDASLKMILDDIGKRMRIDVVADVPEDEKVTVKLDNLSLEETIKRLSGNYVYLMDSEREKGKITKIVVLPRAKGEPTTDKSLQSQAKGHAKRDSPKPEQFKFEFDPSRYVK